VGENKVGINLAHGDPLAQRDPLGPWGPMRSWGPVGPVVTWGLSWLFKRASGRCRRPI